MALLIDLFGYLSVMLHGLTILAQSMAVGGILFLVLLAGPMAPRLGQDGPPIAAAGARIAAWSAIGLVVCEAATVALQTAVLAGTLDMPVADIVGANFALAGMAKAGAAVLIALLLFVRGRRAAAAPLLVLAIIVIAAATLTTHAAARLADRPLLLAVEGLHQLGAAIWVGGLPCFLLALARLHDGAGWRLAGERFSRMSMVGVTCIVVSGGVMSVLYVGDWRAVYGTAFGVMVGAKVAMFLMLLALGAGNFLLIRRLGTNPATPIGRLKRFAEVEFGIGICIFFAAASLTSVAPAVDMIQDRVTWHEVEDRNKPEWPRLHSPDFDALALPALQAQLDREAAAQATAPQPAFVPGSGVLPPRNAADIAWSEYNHHWSGLFVLAIGLLALVNQSGARWARHWPLLFLGLAGFLFLRSDPEVWPLGDVGFFASLRDVEVAQHRVFVLLIIAFGLFEWRVRALGWGRRGMALVFPLLTVAGGALLLTHSHAIANVKDQLLIELTHTPLALAAIIAGWGRWLELRQAPPVGRAGGWVWPVCFMLIGLLLVGYREA